jgi:hypothetical protein
MMDRGPMLATTGRVEMQQLDVLKGIRKEIQRLREEGGL